MQELWILLLSTCSEPWAEQRRFAPPSCCVTSRIWVLGGLYIDVLVSFFGLIIGGAENQSLNQPEQMLQSAVQDGPHFLQVEHFQTGSQLIYSLSSHVLNHELKYPRDYDLQDTTPSKPNRDTVRCSQSIKASCQIALTSCAPLHLSEVRTTPDESWLPQPRGSWKSF